MKSFRRWLQKDKNIEKGEGHEQKEQKCRRVKDRSLTKNKYEKIGLKVNQVVWELGKHEKIHKEMKVEKILL